MKSPCPRCRESGRDRSGDNLVTYPDGGYHCFSCGYHKGGRFMPKQAEADEEVEFPKTIEVPIRGTQSYEWLESYGLTDQEIQTHFRMDRVSRRHFYSVKDATGNLRFMEFRAVDGRKPKTRSYGDKPHDSLVYSFDEHLRGSGGRVVLVEDIVSGIKVSRYSKCLCLFGSHLSAVGTRFVSGFDSVTIWLDADKYIEAIELSQQLSLFVNSVDVIYSEQDPKDYYDADLKRYLI